MIVNFKYYNIQLFQSCKRCVDECPRFRRGVFRLRSFRAKETQYHNELIHCDKFWIVWNYCSKRKIL